MSSNIYLRSLTNINHSHQRVEQCKQRLLNLSNPDYSVRVKVINEVIDKLELSKFQYVQSVNDIEQFYKNGGFQGKVQQIKDWWGGSPLTEAKQDVDFIEGQVKFLEAQKNESEKEFWKQHFSTMTPDQIHSKVKEIESIVKKFEATEAKEKEESPPLQYHHVALLHENLEIVQSQISEGLNQLKAEPIKRSALTTSEKKLTAMADRTTHLADKVMGLGKQINPQP